MLCLPNDFSMMFLSLLRRPTFSHVAALCSTLRWKSAFLGFTLPIVLVGGYQLVWGSNGSDQTITGEIVTVGQRDIALTIKALGTVTLANEQQLRFNVLGTVDKIHVEEGATVKKDDLIAELQKTDPLADIRQAELSVNEAWLQVQDLEASKGEQILTAQNSVRSLERQLEEAYGDVVSGQQEVENTLEQARRTVLEKEAATEKAQKDMASAIGKAITDADDLLDSIVEVLNGDDVVRGATRYDVFEIAFQYNDYSLKNDVEFAYYDANNAYNALREKYPSIANETDVHTLRSALAATIEVVQEIKNLADISYDFLKTAVPSNDYTDAEINTLKGTMNTARQSAITLIGTLNTQQATLTTQGVTTTQQALEKAREDLAILEEQKVNKVTSADTQQRTVSNLNDDLRAKQANLEQTQTSLDVQISQKRNTLAQRTVSLEKARRALEDYELRAPFDGIVRRIDFQVGDKLLADASETKYIVLENPDYFIITVELDQVDVVNVKVGQKASITLDAIANEVFEGTVDMIDTTPVTTSGVVSYEVKILLQPPEGRTILSGMTATVKIEVDARSAVVAVPNLALHTQGSRSYVLGEDGSSMFVETGLTDGSYTEITEGLSVGDRIQSVNVSLNTGSTTQSERQQSSRRSSLVPGMGGGGPPPGAL